MTARSYRFGDASRPGVILGLAGRQLVPLVGGVLWLAFTLQIGMPLFGIAGPILGCAIAFGRWRGTPLAETAAPSVRLWSARRTGRARWVRPSLLGAGPGYEAHLPVVLDGLELIEVPVSWIAGRAVGMAVVRDRHSGTVTAVFRVHGRGFPLASSVEQDGLVAGWGTALSPFAREKSPVSRVVWQEWAHPVGDGAHREFLTSLDALDSTVPAAADYRALLDQQTPATVAHEVIVAVTVDQRKVRVRHATTSRLPAAIDTLTDELRLFAARLETAGLGVDPPLSPAELSAAIRLRSDPGRAAQVTTLARSLAAATGRATIEWGPMTVEPAWGAVHVDGSWHRTYRVASWPPLPVGADWMSSLLVGADATRTVTVILEPVPMSRAARAADREVMGREADADMKESKGFRVSARDRKRLADVEARERELSEGHAEFRFVGLVDVAAPNLEALDDASATVEQAAAQSLVDLRPLEARHDLGWVACLPLGRNIARRGGP